MLNAKPAKVGWTVWEEHGKYPNVILETLSPSTANTDKDFKKKLYQDTFRTPDYFWFDPESLEFAGFSSARNTIDINVFVNSRTFSAQGVIGYNIALGKSAIAPKCRCLRHCEAKRTPTRNF